MDIFYQFIKIQLILAYIQNIEMSKAGTYICHANSQHNGVTKYDRISQHRSTRYSMTPQIHLQSNYGETWGFAWWKYQAVGLRWQTVSWWRTDWVTLPECQAEPHSVTTNPPLYDKHILILNQKYRILKMHNGIVILAWLLSLNLTKPDRLD